jgi:hydrogenase maturation protein HypF
MKLIFKGIVQGVGFRPTIYRIAQQLGYKGYVLNKGSEVEVVIDKDPQPFINQVKKQLPPLARITDIVLEEDHRRFDDFTILHSTEGEHQSLIPADTAICSDCLTELFDPTNRRYHFPFTNCTVCGARFSLINAVPYDRERTAMKPFPLCTLCQKEYTTPSDRRYHAQTISCPTCGPTYTLYDSKGHPVKTKDPIKHFAEGLDQGLIGVIKSWGGMHLCCTLDQISRFREWYKRPQKSFAVMVRDLKAAKKYGALTSKDEDLLQSNKRPIVLVKKTQAEEVSPGLDTIGLFLPYTGLHHVLFSLLRYDALLMTSANIPGEPMMIRNEEVFSLNADCYLLHNREISNRIDDTVVKPWKDHVFFLRKSRGYVPDPLPVSYNDRILSVGAGENVYGAVSSDGQLYATQYVGNSQYYSTIEFLEKSLRHLMKLTMDKPGIDAVAADLHPRYETKHLARRFSEEFSVPLYEIQHHWAHAAALLLDTGEEEGMIMVLDGLGYGTDGTLWGGEVLHADFQRFQRVGHLEHIPLLGGDSATRDPRRLVFAIFDTFDKERFFSGSQAALLRKLRNHAPLTSSCGRLLDALSCCLGICTQRTYAGEPAMKLEKYLQAGALSYTFETEVKNGVVQTLDLFRQLDDMKVQPFSEKTKADLSFSFVKCVIDALTDLAIEQAVDHDLTRVGVTGGVSYNIPILEMIEQRVQQRGLELLVHRHLPSGDGCISLGQNVIAAHLLHHDDKQSS